MASGRGVVGESKEIWRRGAMKQYFKALLETRGVLGLMLLSPEGKVLFKEDLSNVSLAGPVAELAMQLVGSLPATIKEADMLFSEQRVYLRWTHIGPLFVFLATSAPIAMTRLHCDTLVPNLKLPKRTGGLKRFIDKWR
jgi:hypothetical protein